MPRFKDFEPKGVIPACLLPLHDDLRIEAGYRKHLRDVAAVDGISALTVNAHASEVPARSRSRSGCSRSPSTRSATACRW
jgi:4-hydroxy-tetrahydrodipicolinate synthase